MIPCPDAVAPLAALVDNVERSWDQSFGVGTPDKPQHLAVPAADCVAEQGRFAIDSRACYQSSRNRQVTTYGSGPTIVYAIQAHQAI
jgi:hypothetical protein